ncbi:MAG: dockerin type I repeat-containing protein [Clostridia bacterium]|nr:dockerin type I repeat-containing protein [Clostridia bacterium]
MKSKLVLRKTLGLLLTAAVVICMLPLSIISASAADYTIDELKIELDGVATGNVITKDSVKVTTDHCFINEQTLKDYFKCLQVSWYDQTDEKEITIGKDKYEMGHTYLLQIPVASDAERGTSKPSRAQYWFRTVSNGSKKNIYGEYYTIYKAGVDVTVNGEYAECEHDDSYDNNNKYCRRIAVSYTFTVLNDIGGVSVSLDDPYAGRKPGKFPVISESGIGKYSLYSPSDVSGYDDGVVWWDKTALTEVDNDTEFIDGHSYTATICLKANYGYRFTGIGAMNLPIAYIGVHSCNVQRYTGSDKGDIIFIKHDYGVCTKPQVNTVRIRALEKPRPDCHPDFRTAFEGDEGYEPAPTKMFTDGIRWVDKKDYQDLKSTDVFKEGHEYICYLLLKSKDGYEFSTTSDGEISTVSVTVNDKSKTPGHYSSYSLSDRILVSVDFGVCEYEIISKIGVKDIETTPRPGCTPDYEATVEGSAYTYGYYYKINTDSWRNGIHWCDFTDNDRRMDPDTETFIDGHSYYVFVDVVPQPGFRFATNEHGMPNITATVNGKTATVGAYAGEDSSKLVSVGVYTDKCKIEEIDGVYVSGITEPVPGYSPVFSAVSDEPDEYHIFTDFSTGTTNTYAIDGVSWYDRDTGKYLSPYDKFVSGHSYSCAVYLLPNTGFTFPGKTDSSGNMSIPGTLNGRTGAVRNNIGRLQTTGGVLVTYTFGKDNVPTLYTFSVEDVVYPRPGKKPSYTATPGQFTKLCTDYHSTNMYNFYDGIMWYDKTDSRRLEPNDTFIEGHTYYMDVVLETTHGCEFAFTDDDTYHLYGTIGGNEALGSAITDNKGERRHYLVASAEIGVCENYSGPVNYLSRVDLSGIVMPVAGEKAEFFAKSLTEGVYVDNSFDDDKFHNGVCWIDMTEYHALEEGEKFVDEHYYQLNVIFSAEDGYEFSESGGVSNLYTYINGEHESSMTHSGSNSKKIRQAYASYKCKPQEPVYNITVKGGSASLGGNTVFWSKFGEMLTLACSNTITGTFDHWECSDKLVDIADIYSPVTTFKMPKNDVTFTAVTNAPQSETYNITVIGGVALDKDNHEITSAEYGKSVYLMWYAPQNRTFDHWEADTNSVDIDDIHSSATKFIMPKRDVTITAVEKADNITEYTISVTGGKATDVYFHEITSAVEGDLVHILWNSSSEKTFDHWECDDSSVSFDDNTSTFAAITMPANNITITAIEKDIGSVPIKASCTVTAPKAGEHPDFTAVSSNESKYTVTVSDWYLDDGSEYPLLSSSDTFEEGKTYRVRVEFTAKPGNEFSNETKFYINGQETMPVGSDIWETRFTVGGSAYSGLYGDVDKDSEITSNDALMILRASIGMKTFSPQQFILADVDVDGAITSNDALAVLRYSVGMSVTDSLIKKPVVV